MFVFHVHCVYPLRLVIAMFHLSYQHHLSFILYFYQIAVNVLLPLLSYQLWLSDAWAKSCQCKYFYLMCNWMCNVNFYSCMLGEPETLLLLNLPTTTAACSCVCMSLCVTCALPVRWPSVWPSQYMWQLFVVVCMPFDITRQDWKNAAWSFLASSYSKQTSLCFII